ncbi:hypothetical protein U0355_04240 [Salimicrobium sp. PL1-032A]
MCEKCDHLEMRIRQQEETVAQLIEMVASMKGTVGDLVERKETIRGTR